MQVHARVLYIDIDVHHGDGVEEAFYLTDRWAAGMTVNGILGSSSSCRSTFCALSGPHICSR